MNTALDGQKTRSQYLDGLRGFACLQVVFLHVFSGYFPGLVENHGGQLTAAARIQNSPLFTFYDGFMGVFLFFFLSGYVLTGAFDRSGAKVIQEIQARVVRLWLPTIGFGVLSLALYLIFQSSHAQLGPLVHSNFLRHCWSVDDSPYALAREILVTPLFAGYQNAPLVEMFPWLHQYVADSATSLNSPVWSMSVELQGSIMVLGFTRLRRAAPVLWAGLVCCVVAWLPSEFAAFALGHAFGVLRLADREYAAPRGVVSGLGILSVVIGVSVAWPCRNGTDLLAGSGLIFIGAVSTPVLRKILSHPALVRMGELSFTMYLIHWAAVFGPGAWLVLKAAPFLGLPASRIIGAVAVTSAVIWCSTKLVVIDRLAVALAHGVRRGQLTSLATIFPYVRGIIGGRLTRQPYPSARPSTTPSPQS